MSNQTLKNKIINGDSLKELKKIPDETFDLIFADPPYNLQLKKELSNYLIKTIIKGDQKIKEISAASIIAKVSRDKLMLKMSESFKKYKWDLNAGYGTRDHINAIRKYGVTRFHRKTFNPIHNILSHRKK